MNGLIKKIKGIFPVTTTNAVYIDGTNKTLQEAINNKELGGTTTATTSGRGFVQIKLRGNTVIIEGIEPLGVNGTIRYSFPPGDSDRMRRMYAWTPSGRNNAIELPDGELALNQALIYNFDTNTTRVETTSWGNVSLANNEIILLYNDYATYNGRIITSGALAPYIVSYEQPGGIPVKEVPAYNLGVGNGKSQGMFIIDDKMYLWGNSSDDLAETAGECGVRTLNNVDISGFKHFLGHMNAPSYSASRDIMIVGNGSKIYDQTSLPMKGYICPNAKAIFENRNAASPALTFTDFNAIELDLSQFTGEFKAQLCWGDESTDFVFLMTNEHRIIRKLKLGKGAEDLGNGTIIPDCGENDYNGTYAVIQKWRTEHSDVVGGFKYHNGCLYSAVKGDIGIRKMELCSNGHILNSYIAPFNKVGQMQGIDIVDGTMYAYTDSVGYRIDMKNI